MCCVAIQACKQAGVITNLSAFDVEKGKKCQLMLSESLIYKVAKFVQGSQFLFFWLV